MGIGRILWVGRPAETTQAFAGWLLADPSPFAGSAIHDYPFDVEFGSELAWIEGGARIDVMLECSEDPRASHQTGAWPFTVQLHEAEAGWALRYRRRTPAMWRRTRPRLSWPPLSWWM
jgi:hypothetical protein